MKTSGRFIWFVFSLLSLSTLTFAESSGGHKIGFKIQNIRYAKAKIGIYEGSVLKYIDSSLHKPELVFEGQDILPEGLYVLDLDGATLDFIVSEQNFILEAGALDNPSKIKVTNSLTNSIFFDYRVFVKKNKDLINDIKKSASGGLTDAAKSKINEIGKKVQLYRDSIFKQYPENLACKIIRAGLDVKMPSALKGQNTEIVNRSLRSHLFDNIDLKDERLIHTPYVEAGILKALKLTAFVPDSIAKTCDEVLIKTTVNMTVYQYSLTFLQNYFQQSNKPWMDVLYTYIARKYYLAGKASWIDSTEISVIKANVKRMDTILTGKIAPPLDFIDTLGRVIPLYSVKAKYTILYFWDADCSHCQEVTPQLWEYYKEIKKHDVEVYAVTIQQVWFSWKDYLKKYKMDWINVFEPEKIQEVYKIYQIGSTPNIFLLDKDKRILAKRLTLKELKMYLNVFVSKNEE